MTGTSVSYEKGNLAQRYNQTFHEDDTDEFFADSIARVSPSVLARLLEGTGTERDLTFFLKAIEKSDEYKGMGYLTADEYIKKIMEAGDMGVLNQMGKIKAQGDDGNDNQSPFRAVIEAAGEKQKQPTD